MKFCHKIGLTYVSCSPFRVPVARLAAAQAAVTRIQPQDPAAWFRLAQFQTAASDTAGAIVSYGKFVELASSTANAVGPSLPSRAHCTASDGTRLVWSTDSSASPLAPNPRAICAKSTR